MCGIVGWIDTKPISKEILQAMCNKMKHRGPDSQQVKLLGNIGLGHSRLSIIDLSNHANQPLPNTDETSWLVYNGEFYTFKKYKKELLRKGYIFRSTTDSEVLIHLYDEYGLDFIHKLRGMYAFGIWDIKAEKLILVRDRVGIKPLYYYQKGDLFLFASEIKVLLEHPDVARELDPRALEAYFSLGYIPGELSIFKGIKKLKAGHYLIYKHGKVRIKRYWELSHEALRQRSEPECVEELTSLLQESINIRLMSDVPIGAFLSGGLDSSLVSCIMAQQSSETINTFSIGFNESKYNELSYARKIAAHIGSNHNEFVVGLNQVESLENITSFYDEPFADSSAIPTYFVSKMARQSVTVALSGDGGDELFGGYNWYSWVIQQSKFNFIPEILRSSLSKAACLPRNNYKGKHFLSVLGLDEFETFYERTSFFSPQSLNKLLKKPCDGKAYKELREFYEAQSSDTLGRLTRTDFHNYLPDDILTKVDRASMSVSLEARVPILDHKICEFAFRLPNKFKIKNGVKKYLLKEVSKPLFPKDFDLARKQGFSIPLKEWFISDLGDMLCDLLKQSQIVDEYLNLTYIYILVSEHRQGQHNHSSKLWSLLALLLWESKYLNQIIEKEFR